MLGPLEQFHLPMFLLCYSVMFLLFQHQVYKYFEPRRAKLVWQFPCHIVCTVVGLWTQWQYWPIDKFGNVNYQYVYYPNREEVHFILPYTFFYAYWIAVVVDFIRSPRDRDFGMMCLHHLATFLALLSSDVLGYRAIGLYVLLLHDSSDIFIMLLKLVAKFECSSNVIASCYLVCMIVWIVTRMYLFVGKLCFQEIVPYMLQHSIWDCSIVPCVALLILAICNLAWTMMLLQLPFHQKRLVQYYEK